MQEATSWFGSKAATILLFKKSSIYVMNQTECSVSLARDHMYIDTSMRGWAKPHFRSSMSCFAGGFCSVFCTKLQLTVCLGMAGYSWSFIHPFLSPFRVGTHCWSQWPGPYYGNGECFWPLPLAKFLSWWHWGLPFLIKHGNISSLLHLIWRLRRRQKPLSISRSQIPHHLPAPPGFREKSEL